MMRKYIVPEQYKKLFNEDVIYCKIINETEVNHQTVYLVKMINYKNRTNVFAEDELKKLNLKDRIKVLKYRGNK